MRRTDCHLSVSLRYPSQTLDLLSNNLFLKGPSTAGEKEQASTTMSKNGTMKRQAILSIDMPTWKDLIRTFNIRESIIEHRKEAKIVGPGARGWYS